MIVIEVKLLQYSKAEEPILVTPSGIVIEVKLSQPEKAKSPIIVTLDGIVAYVLLPPGKAINVVLFLLNNTPSSLE